MANKALIERMNTDPEYRRDMLSRNPALLDWMKDPDLSKSPPNMTWHHNDAPGVLNLVAMRITGTTTASIIQTVREVETSGEAVIPDDEAN